MLDKESYSFNVKRHMDYLARMTGDDSPQDTLTAFLADIEMTHEPELGKGQATISVGAFSVSFADVVVTEKTVKLKNSMGVVVCRVEKGSSMGDKIIDFATEHSVGIMKSKVVEELI